MVYSRGTIGAQLGQKVSRGTVGAQLRLNQGKTSWDYVEAQLGHGLGTISKQNEGNLI